MSDDYLFDGSGPVDLEVARLEKALRPLRHRPPRSRAPWLAGAAVAALALIVAVWWAQGPVPWSSTTASCSGCVWEAGTSLDTTGPAEALVADRGTLWATPGTAVRRLEGARLALDRGEIRVQVAAPPRWLIVELPGVNLVDLGCAYTARVDGAGNAVVQVDTGWVRLEGTTSTTLPAGTVAASWPSGHTGLPVARGASGRLVARVDAYDRGEGTVDDVLAEAVRPEDAITLWHLIERVAPDQRGAVIEALAGVVPGELPGRTGLGELDPDALQSSLAYVVASTL